MDKNLEELLRKAWNSGFVHGDDWEKASSFRSFLKKKSTLELVKRLEIH
jgi:hypothetical protein